MENSKNKSVKFLKIKSIEIVKKETDVYDAEVENTHCFFANDMLVHNCLGGVVARRLEWEMDDYGRAVACIDAEGKAERDINYYLDVFGDDFYLEVQNHDNGDNCQPIYNQWLLNFGRPRKIPFVITSDCHYLTQEDAKLHEILMAMQMKQTVEEYREKSKMQYGPFFYVASPEEMLERAQDLGVEESYYNTMKVAEKCNVSIELGNYEEPIFDVKGTDDYEQFQAWKKEKNYD